MANPKPDTSGLRPPWTSETAPKGRKNLGLSVNEWRNEMGTWPPDEIKSAIESPKATAVQIMAGVEILQALTGNLNAIAQACDYTNGKATQTNLTRTEVVHVRRTFVHSRN